MRSLQLRSRLCFITVGSPAGRQPRRTVEQALRAGVGIVQYDARGLGTSQMVTQAVQLAWLCRRLDVPLVVGGRVDVALAALADGVHLGGEDMPVALARRLMGPRAIIGVDCHTAGEAREAERQGASYVRVGPVFNGQPGQIALGLLYTIARAVQIPVCAAGGIGPDNVSALRTGPADLVCVDDAITEASDPCAVTKSLVVALREDGVAPA